jgi:predicted oxidoreductase
VERSDGANWLQKFSTVQRSDVVLPEKVISFLMQRGFSLWVGKLSSLENLKSLGHLLGHGPAQGNFLLSSRIFYKYFKLSGSVGLCRRFRREPSQDQWLRHFS